MDTYGILLSRIEVFKFCLVFHIKNVFKFPSLLNKKSCNLF